ncbi:heavy-metal-associated domain-containing protein [Microvirga sp. VF16]|uniref:heavy-metal-associated domain-containing protein n=1 Tax=Microvirga sp. VF16 TaxID=2807101 RepID=UPI00193E84BD|nr:heavy-metal-associated domain-containing protein [Microvirga sp. VF16]QRM34640.1 heavy-metal-associated domain-containing protein [Microvirga sp. VF16]
MCGCATHQSQGAAHEANQEAGTLTLRVEDMTCSHCAGTLTKAIEASLPGTQVQADPATKLVSVQGAGDLAAIKEIVAAAGYTPSEVPAHI